MQRCLDTLGLNDTLGTGGKVIDEMLISLLQCRRIKDEDSTSVKGFILNPDYNLDAEEEDSCELGVRRNWQSIYKGMHKKEFVIERNTYWDEKNGRVYQFINNGKRKEKLKIKLKIYRQDCLFHLLYL